jgi:serine/threonine protein phosphatase PrpC
MSLRLIAASKTDVGKQREQNEDACYYQIVEDGRQASGIFIVADGMGGYHAGEVASRIAVETIRDTLQPMLAPTSSRPTVPLNREGRRRGKRQQATNGSTAATAEPSDDGQMTQELGETLALEHYAGLLQNSVHKSSEAVVDYGHEHSEAQGLGSTVTAALVLEGQAFIANVGDSRTYLLRDGKLKRITHDHSLVERLVEAGQIDREDVYDHPSRNLIYRSLGAGKAEVDVDIFTENLRPGDALLLCSDGLWEMVRDPQLVNILNEVQDPAEACDLLIQRANENGGEDNITAVLVRCLEG